MIELVVARVRRRSAETAAGGGVIVSRRAQHALLVLLGFGALALRRPDALANPSLWAEDGTIFLRQALTHSFASTLVTPYADYLHLVPRLIAGIAVRLPFAWIPESFAIASLMLATVAVAPALSNRLSWLIPPAWGRTVLFSALIFLPAVDDVAGNVANLQWYFGITLVLLALSSDPPSRLGRAGEIASTTLLGLTAPFCVLATPLFWIRARREGSRHSVAVALTLTTVALLQGALVVTSQNAGGVKGGMAPAGVFVTVWGLNLGALAVLGVSVFRDVWIAGLSGAIWALACGYLALSVLSLIRLPRTAAVTLATALVAAVASATLRLRSDLRGLEGPGAGGRYFVIPLGILAIILVAALAREAGRRTRASGGRRLLLAALPASLMLQGCLLNVRLPPRPDIGWAQTTRCVESHRTCIVRLDPDGWSMSLPPL